MKVYIDISNLLNVNFITGIQRVVREIVLRMLQDKQLEIILLAYSFQKDAFQRIDNDKFLQYYKEHIGEKEDICTLEYINYEDIPSGTVFFDIDSVWNTRLKRGYLFPILKQKGVKIVTQLYDIIPITHPQFSHENTVMNFMLYLGANIQYADLIITSAHATWEALNTLTDKLGVKRKKVMVVPLGGDFAKKREHLAHEVKIDKTVKKIASGKYILLVGTIEPRKNHRLLLDALEDKLKNIDIKVVFAGRIGWNVEELEARIRKHELLNEKLFFVESPDDATIDYLYKNAFLVAFPTFNEGFGLPILEAFERNVPVIASDIKVLHEVAGDYADYFDPYDKADFVRCIEELIDQPEKYQKRKERLREFKPYTWDRSAEQMVSAICSVIDSKLRVDKSARINQIVVLTARNEDILATLPYIEHFMPFITKMLICCPDENVNELQKQYAGRIRLEFLTDSVALNGEPLPEDHAARNFFLRCKIMRHSLVDDIFIMTDDDYRPLRMLSQEDFVQKGKFLSYYCYNLKYWKGTYGNPTSFDLSMKLSRKFLEENDYPTMMYSSHQMQVIDKRIFCQMLDRHPGIEKKGLCDWSVYFNYGLCKYPELFKPIPYVSMGWPGAYSDWKLYVQPKEYIIENYYSALYEKGEVFEGFSKQYHDGMEEENAKKAVLYAKELQKQMDGRAVYESYCEKYRMEYGEMPSFIVMHEEDNMVIHTPAYLKLKSACWTRIPFRIDDTIPVKLRSKDILLMWWFPTATGEKLTSIRNVPIDMGELCFDLPVRTPDYIGKIFLNIRIILKDRSIEKNIGLEAVLV